MRGNRRRPRCALLPRHCLAQDRPRPDERQHLRRLKRGGVYGIVDHSGRDGTGSKEAKSLHRIEEKVVRDEIVRAGFKLLAERTFLRNSKDTRDWNAAPIDGDQLRGPTDRFVSSS